jgi:Rrf2 family transcriptional regulator, cysteine metabolism repressor
MTEKSNLVNQDTGGVMRISTKGRYGLAVMVKLAEKNERIVSIATLSSELGLSKIYLEQVLSLLKAGNLVTSLKGPQGGYALSRYNLNIKEILMVLEPSLFEVTETGSEDAILNHVIGDQVYASIQSRLEKMLETITLESIVSTVVDHRLETPMFYI